MFKLNKTAAYVAAALLAVGAGSAQATRIDPFGLGGAGGVYQVANLGWNNGNGISTPIATNDGSAIDLETGDIVGTFGHAKLQGLSDADGNTLAIAGFDPNKWSYVFGFSEVAASATATGNVLRTTSVVGAPNFFQIWANGTGALDLSGKGFNGDGGATLLLEGVISDYNPASGIGQTSFDVSSVVAVPLDQFGADNYAGYSSTTGTGSGKLAVKVTMANAAYFLDGISLLTLDLNTDSFLNLPYVQVNPSSCFWDGSAYFSGAGNGIAGGCGEAADGGTIGPINGVDLRAGGDPDWTNVMFQTRATTVIPTVIPEPGTLALMGLGALGMFMRRRKS